MNERILIIDDDASVRKVLHRILEMAGDKVSVDPEGAVAGEGVTGNEGVDEAGSETAGATG